MIAIDNKYIIESNNNLAELIQKATLPIILDFWAPWCGPCQQLNPVLTSLIEQVQDKIQIIKVNIDHHPAACAQYNVRQVPTLIFISTNQNVVGRALGYKTLEELTQMLEQFFSISL